MRSDFISLIIPVHNGAGFFASALESIRQQEWPHLEILIVDDGSMDNLTDRIRGCGTPVVYLRQQRRGPGAARNLGIREASSDRIAFLDIDDRWTPGHLGRLHAALEQNPEMGFAQGQMRQFVLLPDGQCMLSGSYRMPYLGSCLFHRRVFDQCGTFDEGMQMGEDYDLMFRCWEHDVPKVCVEEVSLLYRRHAGNMTRGKNKAANLEVIARRLQRIRSGAVDPKAPRLFRFDDYIGDIRNFADSEVEPAEKWNLSSAS